MVTVLAMDVGSSSVKASVLVGTQPVSPLVRVPFPTQYDGVRAEVRAADILRAVSVAARGAVSGSVGKGVDVVAISAMSPSWVAMDRAGDAISPVVTHQDRRSVEEAHWIESTVGRERHLEIVGCRPVPGGISSTTALWFLRHQKGLMRRADLVGHVQTLLLRRLTGARAMDPSNASFTGLYQTIDAEATDPEGGWDSELMSTIGVRRTLLPSVLPGDAVAGQLTAGGARLLGVLRGTPVLTGIVDTSAAVILIGSRPGMMVNVSGSTDVLAVVTEEARPGEGYLTRALGVGNKWLSVATIPAAGSALAWAKGVLFAEMDEARFFKLVAKLAKKPPGARGEVQSGGVSFDLGLAGSRVTVEQPSGGWSGLRLSTTREEMLGAVIEALARASAARLTLLRSASSHGLRREVLRTGGTGKVLAGVLYRDWNTGKRGRWGFVDVEEAGLLGLGQLACGRPV